jgi:AraC-like DNA-binding protein
MWPETSLATAVLGVFIALPMLARPRSRPGNVWLGLFLLAMSALELSEYLLTTDRYLRFPQLVGLLDWPVAAIGALYYCYVRSVVGLGNGKRQLWHFTPLCLLVGLIAFFRITTPVDVIASNLTPFTEFTFEPQLLAFQCLAAAYALATLRLLHRYRQKVRQNFSSTHNRNLTWLSWLTFLIILLLVLWIPMNLWRGTWQVVFGLDRILMLYLIGWFGLRQTVVVFPDVAAPAARDAIPFAPLEPLAGDGAPAPAAVPSGDKYARSGMTAADEALIAKRLKQRMQEQRDFTAPDLRLSELAERIGCSTQWLSQYLNEVEGRNFFDYINGLRVAEVQSLMLQAQHRDSTFLDLAFAAGFNSKSTFYIAFKKYCGESPSSWRKSQRNPNEPVT